MTRKPDPTPAETPRSISPGVAAGRLYERLRVDFEAEQEELRATPATIRKRHQERREAWLDAAPEAVRELVRKMVAEDKPQREPGDDS
jgi:hypothetical protein